MVVAAFALWVVALVFVLIGVKNLLVRALRKRRCTATVMGDVVDVHVKHTTSGRSGDSDGVTTTEYIPTVEYVVEGVNYSEKFTPGYSSSTYHVGQSVEIMYDPKKPTVINTKGKSNTTDLVVLGIGVVLAVVGVVLVAVS